MLTTKRNIFNHWKSTNRWIRWYNNTITVEKECLIKFTEHKKTYFLSLHYNAENSYLVVSGAEIITLKAKDSQIKATLLCLGNISRDVLVGSMDNTAYHRYDHDFGVDYDATAAHDILTFASIYRRKTAYEWGWGRGESK